MPRARDTDQGEQQSRGARGAGCEVPGPGRVLGAAPQKTEGERREDGSTPPPPKQNFLVCLVLLPVTPATCRNGQRVQAGHPVWMREVETLVPAPTPPVNRPRKGQETLRMDVKLVGLKNKSGSAS